MISHLLSYLSSDLSSDFSFDFSFDFSSDFSSDFKNAKIKFQKNTAEMTKNSPFFVQKIHDVFIQYGRTEIIQCPLFSLVVSEYQTFSFRPE